MHRSSLRTWLLVASVVFSLLVIGGFAIATYIVVSDGMAVEAHDSAIRIARGAVESAKRSSTQAQLEAAEEFPDVRGTEDAVRRAREAERLFLRKVPDTFETAALGEGEFAIYDDSLDPIWFSDERAVVEEAGMQRRRALEIGQTAESVIGQGGMPEGIVGPAQLGVVVVSVPLEIPGGGRAVLDVSYYAEREEHVIDAIRAPMFTLAVSALVIMVVVMQTSLAWVLKLVSDLRRAADSIDAGRLDVRLPAEGDNEISDLARSLNRLIDRLKRKGEAQARFVADASHELATPVAGIRGYTNILRAWGADDPEVRAEAISAIDRESRRMARLCGDLLALVRDERTLTYKNERFDVNARVREVLAAAATRYIDRGLQFEGPAEGQLLMIGDPDRVEDAISILVDNAAKYTEPGGRVSVRTRRRRDSILVEVEDTGIGIPVADLPNIFDRFYRSDVSRPSEPGGFGLGLPIAKSIVEGAGGLIRVESTVGVGTRFTIVLPRGRD